METTEPVASKLPGTPPARPPAARSARQKIAAATSRPFAAKAAKRKSIWDYIVDSSMVVIVLGILFTGTGIICLVPFNNAFAKFMLFAGLMMAFAGFAIKLIEIALKIVGVRS